MLPSVLATALLPVDRSLAPPDRGGTWARRWCLVPTSQEPTPVIYLASLLYPPGVAPSHYPLPPWSPRPPRKTTDSQWGRRMMWWYCGKVPQSSSPCCAAAASLQRHFSCCGISALTSLPARPRLSDRRRAILNGSAAYRLPPPPPGFNIPVLLKILLLLRRATRSAGLRTRARSSRRTIWR